MQIQTLKLANRAVAQGPNPGEKVVTVKNDTDPNNAYYGTKYSLNTKYIVDITEHPKVGCVVELVNGNKVHVEETVEFLTIRSNQR